MDTGELILIGLVVGGGAYLLLRKPAAPAAPVQPPCAVGYQGVTVSCKAVTDALGSVAKGVEGALSIIPGVGPADAPLQHKIDIANANGIVYTGSTGWNGNITGPKLPAGYKNIIGTTGRPELAPSDPGARWIGTAVQPRVTA